jgi:hypothetical protein
MLGPVLEKNYGFVMYGFFRVGATFEMRTVLYGIRLLIDKLKLVDRVFISNIESGEESMIAERQRERECVRQSTAENEG